MKTLRKISTSSLLALFLFLVLSVSAFAADSTVTYKGAKDGFTNAPGSSYTTSDLFDNFKDTMPGDKLTETIEFKNEATDCDYIKLYLRTELHDENGNPLIYSETFENADGKDQANVAGERDETVASMQDFLAQLTVRIYNGTTLIYEASPAENGALTENLLLADLRSGESLSLKVELDVPIELGNEYANRVGEVDWVFVAEAFDDPEEPAEVTPEPPKSEQIEQPVKTGDSNMMMAAIVLMFAGAVILMVLAAIRKKANSEE